MDINILEITPAKWMDREEYFSELLSNQSIRNQLPLLNVEGVQHLKNSTLVRFQGMIQDMHSPELYLEKFDIVNEESKEEHHGCSRYCEEIVLGANEYVNIDSSTKVIAERQTYSVISVPGLNSWSQITKVNETESMPHEGSSAGAVRNKRSFEEAMETERETYSSANESCTKKVNFHKDVSDGNNLNSDHESINLLKNLKSCFPLPEETCQLCLLKVYKNYESLKLNDVYEFVGFLAMEPVTVGEDSEIRENNMEFQSSYPLIVSSVPKIHCVSFKKLVHSNPLVLNNEQMDTKQLNSAYENLLLVLTQLLLGDDLAAEYMIFHLISKIYMRPNLLPLGKFSLNISNIPNLNFNFVSELYKFIEKFIPKSYYIPLTLENLNNLTFIPKKDNESNSLFSGILQLSENTHLVLDETKMNAGKLNSTGINNVKAIVETIKNQRVSYDFSYYPIDFNCDIPFLILSEGKSMMGSDVHIILKPDTFCINTIKEIFEAAEQFLKPDILNNIRRYLTLARLTQYELTDKVEQLVTNEFVSMRQQRDITADDLHSMLVLSRLVAISQGKQTLDEESWKKACKLEQERKARFDKNLK